VEVLAASHIHSDWSYDGSWSLDSLAAKFRERGCRVLMMTEHDRGFTATRLDEYRAACTAASSARLLMVPGIEYSDAANCVHVLVWGRVPFLGEGLPTLELLEKVREHGGFAVFAHPSRRSAWRLFRPEWAQYLLGIELWNRKYDGWAPSTTAPDLLERAGVMPFVGLDFHTARQSFPLTMSMEVPATIAEDAVLGCLRARRCHARAFGLSLDHEMVRRGLSVLDVAEQGRRAAAALAKRSRAGARS
jgi:hypothetical protein